MSWTSSSSEDEAVVLSVAAYVVQDSSAGQEWIRWVSGSRRNIDRGLCSWYRDYLSPNPIYHLGIFRRRFRVPLCLFKRFLRELPSHEPRLAIEWCNWNKRSCDLAEDIVLFTSPGWRLIIFFAWWHVSHEHREHVGVAYFICSAIHKCYGEQYLNKIPTAEELRAIETKYAAR